MVLLGVTAFAIFTATAGACTFRRAFDAAAIGRAIFDGVTGFVVAAFLLGIAAIVFSVTRGVTRVAAVAAAELSH